MQVKVNTLKLEHRNLMEFLTKVGGNSKNIHEKNGSCLWKKLGLHSP